MGHFGLLIPSTQQEFSMTTHGRSLDITRLCAFFAGDKLQLKYECFFRDELRIEVVINCENQTTCWKHPIITDLNMLSKVSKVDLMGEKQPLHLGSAVGLYQLQEIRSFHRMPVS